MNDQAFWALIGTLFGGAGLAIINKLLGHGKEKFDLSAAIREELRKDNTTYRKEIDELNRRLESWQQKYYENDQAHKKTIEKLELDVERLKRMLAQNGISYSDILKN